MSINSTNVTDVSNAQAEDSLTKMLNNNYTNIVNARHGDNVF